MKKTLAIVLTLCLAFTVPAFADTTTPAQPAPTEQTTTAPTTPGTTPTTTTAPATGATAVIPVDATTTQDAGITPDSILYSLDRLMEKIQLALVTDGVKQAELLSKIAQERLAESVEMVDKSNTDLAEKVLEDYQASLDQAVNLVQTAMEQGKQVAAVMDGINTTNIKDAATVDKILNVIPDQYKDKVKAEIDKVAAATDATTETAKVVEKEDEDQNSVKQDITMKLIEGKVQDPALIAKIKAADLSTRQVIAVISLSEQSKKPLGDVLDMFIANEMGIGATAHQLGLTTKDALKGINESFKEAKETIKTAFKEAMKTVDKEDQDEVQEALNNSLSGANAAKVAAANEKLQKVIADAKAQVAAVSGASQSKNGEKKIEKSSKKHEKDDKAKIEKSDKDENDDEDINEDKDDDGGSHVNLQVNTEHHDDDEDED